MIEVYRQSMAGLRMGLAAVSLGLFAISLMIVYTFEAFGGLEAFEEVFELLPEGFKALFRAQGGFAPNAEGYLAADYRHPIYLIVTSAFVVAVAVGAVAREIERGTVLIVLAAPIARWRYLWAKVSALLTGTVVIMLASIAGTWLGVAITGLSGDVDMTVFLRVQTNTFALAMSIGGIALLVSALHSDGAQATVVVTSIVVTMYFVDFLSVLWGPAGPLGPATVFHYYDPLSVSQESGLPVRDILVLLAVGVGGLAAAFVGFQRRDITR